MQYLSTRGGMEPQSFCEVLLGGLAPDGGLVIPEHTPRIGRALLAAWRELSYHELAFEIYSRFATDIPPADLRRLLQATYREDVFGSADITPVRPLENNLHILECSNGPTLAFKDIALQLIGHLFEYVLARDHAQLNILGATSGDTGSAAEYAMLGKRGIRVFMLSPHGRMSAFQRAQMYSLQDPNIINIACHGVFDECQDIVKAVSEDLAFKSKYQIGTVNSINWARVSAQIVYYFKAYFAVVKKIGDPVSFAVPSGNFGNVLAGHYARQMGLPIDKLIVATNENNVLEEFFRTGVYRPRQAAETHITSSPSMDISKASNFERFVFDLLGRKPDQVKALWQQLAREGSFDLSQHEAFSRLTSQFGFVAGYSTHADRMRVIRDTKDRLGQWVDTHTADAIKVARDYADPTVPTIILETALPIKFAETIAEATGMMPPCPARFDGIMQLPQHVIEMAADVQAVKQLIQTTLEASS